MGMPEPLIREQMEAERKMIKQQAFEVLPENWDALMAFLAMGTQWRTAGMSGIRTGLDYSAVPATLDMMGFGKRTQELFPKLRILEYAAVGVFADKAKKEHNRVTRRAH